MFKTFQLLKGLSAQHIEAIEQSCTIRRYTSGEFLVHEGDLTSDIYFLTAGDVLLSKAMPETNSHVDFKEMSAGQTFGEMAFMDGSPRSCSVKAIGEVEAYCLSKQALLERADEADDIVEQLQIMIQYQVNEYLRHLSDRHTATLYKRIQELEAEEEKLKKQVRELKIEIDEAKFRKDVNKIVDSDFFQDLTEKAQALRQNNQARR